MSDARYEPNGQAAFIILAEILGYDFDRSGVCNGLGYMAGQAILVGETAQFIKRMQSLDDICLSIFKYLKVKCPELNIETDHFDVWLLSLSEDEKQRWFKDLAPKKQKEIKHFLDKQINHKIADQQERINLQAFFDDVIIYAHPYRFPELFDHPIYFQYVTSVIPMLSPSKLDKQGGIRPQKEIVQAFSVKELGAALHYLREEIYEKSTSPHMMIITGAVTSGKGMHTLTIGYDPTVKQWFYFEPNQKLIPIDDENFLAAVLENIFGFNGKIELIMQPYSVNHPELNKLYSHVIGLMNQIYLADASRLTTVNSLGQTVLHLASSRHLTELVQSFAVAGANPDARMVHGLTPLHLCALLRDKVACEALIAAGADINAKDNGLRTPGDFAPELKTFLEEMSLKYKRENPIEPKQEMIEKENYGDSFIKPSDSGKKSLSDSYDKFSLFHKNHEIKSDETKQEDSPPVEKPKK